MSPRVRQQLRQIAGLWLAWTAAGLFYITQDSVPRLYRGARLWFVWIARGRGGLRRLGGRGVCLRFV